MPNVVFPVIVHIFSKLLPLFRNFEIDIRGKENIPIDDSVIFVCNHSNSHDGLVMNEILSELDFPITSLVAWDGLNILSRIIFRIFDGVLIDRNRADSKQKGMLDICGRILRGKNCFIFGEATWNLHPILPMQQLKAGATQIALITGKKIIPTIMEYVEVPNVCKKESELYQKLIVFLGKPITVTPEDELFHQTEVVQDEMVRMRTILWEEL